MYGNFSKDSMEYIITRPDTPRPWTNYLYNKEYCAIVSQAGGGYSFLTDCRVNRIIRWQGQNISTDRPGRYIYLRDEDTGNFWSLTWQPVRKEPQSFECRHGLGYTAITSTYEDVTGKVTYFVPQDDNLEVWIIDIKNNSDKAKKLDMFSYVEFLIGDRNVDLIVPSIIVLYKKADFDTNNKFIFATGRATDEPKNSFNAFIGGNFRIDGYETKKEVFLGRYGELSCPKAVIEGRCQNTKMTWGEDLVGVLQHKINLEPDEEKQLIIVLGVAKARDEARKLLDKYSKAEFARAKLEETKKFWMQAIANVSVKTPDPDLDRFINVWCKYQLYTTNYWSRSPAFYHEGHGGKGYRDSCQDAEGILPINAEYAKQKILRIAYNQRSTGQPAPGWSDLYGVYDEAPFKDHPIWFPLTLCSYLKETGDINFLKQKVKFFDGGSASLYEHAKRNVEFLCKDRGNRGLIHFGAYNHADWNDAFDGCMGKAESVWTAMALHWSLMTVVEMAKLLGDKKTVKKLTNEAKKFYKVVNTKGIGWDGNWYLRGFTSGGAIIGSKKCKEGKIFLNTQSWAVLSGVAQGKRAIECLEAVDKHLDSKLGLELFTPAYTKFNADLGRITNFTPGTKENAAIFCHASAFKIVADCKAGRGNKAYETLKKISPHPKDQEVYKAEPYVFAEYLIGPSNPNCAGEGSFTWLTGTAGWVFAGIINWMFGIRPDFKGLMIDPCIPAAWEHCQIVRPFRKNIYEVDIDNPNHIENGIKKIILDGKEIEGSFIPYKEDGKVHKVRVLMGK